MRMRGEARAAALGRVRAEEAAKQGGSGNSNCRVCRSAPNASGPNAPADNCGPNAAQPAGVACQNPIGMQLLDPHNDAPCTPSPTAAPAATPGTILIACANTATF